jgi:hypothetical protein
MLVLKEPESQKCSQLKEKLNCQPHLIWTRSKANEIYRIVRPKNRMENLKKELEQLRKGAMSIESTTRQKEIQVFIENLLEQQ